MWFRFLMYVAAGVALLPLSLVLAYTISNGWRAAVQPDFYRSSSGLLPASRP